MKKQILEVIEKHPSGSLTRRMIEEKMNLKGSSAFIAFDKAMDEMEDDYEVIRTRKNTFMTRAQSGLVENVIRINRKGTGYVDRPDEPSIVINAKDQKDAMDGDRVLVKTWNDGTEGEVVTVLEHKRTHLIGTYLGTPRGLKCTLDDEKLQNRIVRVRTDKDFRPIPGLKVLLRIENYGTPLRVYVEDAIGHKDDPGVDISAVLLNYDIPSQFPERVLEEANQLPSEVVEQDLTDRTDLRNVVTVTIDGDTSKDFDDAVSVVKVEDGWNLKVSIADVSHYVTENSMLDQEARSRGFSTYVTDRVVPMLPHVLSNGICSLNPQVDRLTITCEMDVLSDGSIKNYRVYPSVICSNERMTYNNVNEILEGDETLKHQYAHLGSLFEDLRDCADAIRGYRQTKGAIDFDIDEAEIVVDETGKPIDVVKRYRGHAERMIEDCMIAANVCVANYMNQNHIPSIYRIHEEPSAKRIKNFKQISARLGEPFIVPLNDSVTPKYVQSYLQTIEESEQFPVLSQQLLRCMSKARYDATCVGHFGIAEEEYLHFTSPIRRYPDLIVHRMLKEYLFSKETKRNAFQDEALMQEIAEETSEREKLVVSAEYEVEDMKKAEYMQSRVGLIADGLITTVTGFGFYVQLENTIEGLVHISSLKDDYYTFDEEMGALVGGKTHRRYMVGQKVRIKVLAASKDNRSIDFGIHSDRKSEKKDAKRNNRSSYGNRRSNKKSNTRYGRSGKMSNRGKNGRKR